jgi:hypothetical protein
MTGKTKFKAIVILTVGLLACAAAAQATGVIEHDDSRLDVLQSRTDRLEMAFRREASGATTSRVQNGPRGRRGPRGARGPQGQAGPQGPAGTFGAVTGVQSSPTFLCSFEAGACAVGSARVDCPPGTKVTGGGYTGAGIVTTVTYNARVGNGWGIIAVNLDEFSVSGLRAEALCAS